MATTPDSPSTQEVMLQADIHDAFHDNVAITGIIAEAKYSDTKLPITAILVGEAAVRGAKDKDVTIEVSLVNTIKKLDGDSTIVFVREASSGAEDEPAVVKPDGCFRMVPGLPRADTDDVNYLKYLIRRTSWDKVLTVQKTAAIRARFIKMAAGQTDNDHNE